MKSEENILWERLLNPRTLKRGWHLARIDTRQDFIEDLYSTDVFAIELDRRIKETINRLKTETYQPQPLFRIEVPKGSLGFRPGTVVQIEDRMVTSAIMILIADSIDKIIPDSVYSWRVKRPIPKQGGIFIETTILDLPYLKKGTIQRKIDPFEPWYANWPAFDAQSRKTFGEDRFRFLATSDIAAYFENIQLSILRDQLAALLPNERRLINLLMSFFESWASRTPDGRPHMRGIPQGNSVSSFLGNAFLLDLDRAFSEFQNDREVKYYRYMDDVRIFTKRIEDARRAIFLMDRMLRKLHLNVQTAKTKILDEHDGEISDALLDDRVNKITGIIDEIKSKYKDKTVPDDPRNNYLSRLAKIARQETRNKQKNKQKIVGTKKPLTGTSLRAFMRWMSAHARLDSHEYIPKLLQQIQMNPDHRLTRRLTTTARLFPKNRSIAVQLMKFIKSEKNIFPHQEAECLRAIRYLSQIPQEVVEYCFVAIQDYSRDPYIRMEAAYVLSRTDLTKQQIRRCLEIFEQESNSYVQSALAALIVQRRQDNQEIVRDKILFHPNEKLRELGKLFRCVKNDETVAKRRLEFIFEGSTGWRICENMAFIHLMSVSKKTPIRRLLAETLKQNWRQIPIVGLRKPLHDIYLRVEESLKSDEA